MMAETDDNKDNQNQTEEDKTSSNQEDVKVENASESDIEDFEIKYKTNESFQIYSGKKRTQWGEGNSNLFLSNNTPASVLLDQSFISFFIS